MSCQVLDVIFFHVFVCHTLAQVLAVNIDFYCLFSIAIRNYNKQLSDILHHSIWKLSFKVFLTQLALGLLNLLPTLQCTL